MAESVDDLPKKPGRAVMEPSVRLIRPGPAAAGDSAAPPSLASSPLADPNDSLDSPPSRRRRMLAAAFGSRLAPDSESCRTLDLQLVSPSSAETTSVDRCVVSSSSAAVHSDAAAAESTLSLPSSSSAGGGGGGVSSCWSVDADSTSARSSDASSC